MMCMLLHAISLHTETVHMYEGLDGQVLFVWEELYLLGVLQCPYWVYGRSFYTLIFFEKIRHLSLVSIFLNSDILDIKLF